VKEEAAQAVAGGVVSQRSGEGAHRARGFRFQWFMKGSTALGESKAIAAGRWEKGRETRLTCPRRGRNTFFPLDEEHFSRGA